MAEDVDRAWIVAAAFRVEGAADDLWRRVRLFLVELLQNEGMSLPEDLAFDREYFRQHMAESRERAREARMRRIGELLAAQSGPLLIEEQIELAAVPGLTEALDGFVSLPIPLELLQRFARRSDFDLHGYERHILAHIRVIATRFDAVPPLLDDHRKDRIFRFIAVIFLAHAGRLDIWQEADHILVKQREAYQQGQDISGRITEAT